MRWLHTHFWLIQSALFVMYVICFCTADAIADNSREEDSRPREWILSSFVVSATFAFISLLLGFVVGFAHNDPIAVLTVLVPAAVSGAMFGLLDIAERLREHRLDRSDSRE